VGVSADNARKSVSGSLAASGYETGFIDYYVSAVLYAPLSPEMRITLGLFLVGFNLLIYLYLLRRHFSLREARD
jgi:hypothetical protein